MRFFYICKSLHKTEATKLLEIPYLAVLGSLHVLSTDETTVDGLSC